VHFLLWTTAQKSTRRAARVCFALSALESPTNGAHAQLKRQNGGVDNDQINTQGANELCAAPISRILNNVLPQ
jgi:hypothetical protein